MEINVEGYGSHSFRQFLNLPADDVGFTEIIGRYTKDVKIKDILFKYRKLLKETEYLRIETYLHYVIGNTYSEITTITGTSKSYMRTLLYNDVRRVYRDLGGYDPYFLLLNDKYTSMTKSILSTLLDRLLEEYKDKPRNISDFSDEEILEMEFDAVEEDDHEFLGGKLVVEPKDIIYDDSVGEGITDEAFTKILEILVPLTKTYINEYSERIDPRVYGYIDHIYEGDNSTLNRVERERRKILLEIFGEKEENE